jgi:alcohol oxidase
MIIMPFINLFAGNPAETETDQQYLTIGTISLYPYSRGSIHITDPSTDRYDFASGFLSSDADIKMQVWGYKQARAIARELPFYTGEVSGAHPRYPLGSTATKPEGKLVYSAEDDAAIEKWIRKTIATTWHSLGTCAMRPRQDGGVVDARLDVYGTQSLKVADMSIAPENIGGNVGNTAFAIGEKVALLIAEKLGIDI